MRRKRNLAQIEIPEDDVEISRDFLGKGGFGAVYIADYGGRNAAAKVMTSLVITSNLHVLYYCFDLYRPSNLGDDLSAVVCSWRYEILQRFLYLE